MKLDITEREAVISSCERYRYTLARAWSKRSMLARTSVCWIMLNPSTANAIVDDPTVRKVIGFSARAGFDALSIVNLFAFRSKDPAELHAESKVRDVVGPQNDMWIRDTLTLSDAIILGWGEHATRYPDRVRDVLAIVARRSKRAMCLGTTQSGEPRHPLMLSYNTPLEDALSASPAVAAEARRR